MAKKSLEIDMIAGSQLRDTQGEMLSVEGADISELEAGRGRFNDNHGKGFFNSVGRVTGAKKIYGPEDFSDPRHEYYWNKVKAPYVYVKGYLYNDEEHSNAKAAAAILRNIHKSDTPLKLKASVEGGVVERGLKDESLLARTKIHSIALTFTPANNATLVEPLSMEKSADQEADMLLIKSVMHLAQDNVPSFRAITRNAQAEKIYQNMDKIRELASEMGMETELIKGFTVEQLVKEALEAKIQNNVQKIHDIVTSQKNESLENTVAFEKQCLIKSNVEKINSLAKMLSAGYGGGGVPTSQTHGSVLQTESLEDGRPKKKKKKKKKTEDMEKGMKYMSCGNCGHEQVYMKHQVKCRKCNKHQSLEKLLSVMI